MIFTKASVIFIFIFILFDFGLKNESIESQVLMEKIEKNDDAFNSIINSRGQNSLNFKIQNFHANSAKLYEDKNFSSLIEEEVGNKNENDYDKDSKITEYFSFCDGKYEINETKPNYYF